MCPFLIFFFFEQVVILIFEQVVILIEHNSCLLEAAVKFSNHGNSFPGFG